MPPPSAEAPSPPSPSRPPLWKAFSFSLILTGLFFILLEALLGWIGLQPRILQEDPFVGFNAQVPLFIPEGESPGPIRMVTAPNKDKFFNRQAFLHPKPPGTFRIFCLGGSTTYGRPYHENTAFSGWLKRYLDKTHPGQCEVINAGGISYASYRVAALMEELTPYEPDLFIVYTGHNEFLEERTYAGIREQSTVMRHLTSGLNRTRTYSALQSLVARTRKASDSVSRYQLEGEVHARLDQSIGPDAYHRDDALREHVRAHFQVNLERIRQRADQAGAALVLVTPAGSLKDCAPFKSEYQAGTSSALREQATDARAQARLYLGKDEPEQALSRARTAVGLDARHAGSQYVLAQCLLALGHTEEAKAAFVRARDEDIVPLRALSELVETVRRYARDTGTPLVDYPQMLEAARQKNHAPAIPGKESFLDHVHPTVEAHGLLARALYKRIMELKLIEPVRPLDEALLQEVQSEVAQSIDDTTRGVAMRNLAKVMSWAGKLEDAAVKAELALRYLGEDAESLFILGLYAADRQRWEDAENFYRRALQQEPDYVKALHNLAIILVRSGQAEEAIGLYRQVLDLWPDHPHARYNLGKAYLKAGRNEEARIAFAKVVRAHPDDADAHYYLGRIHLEQEDFTPAIEHLHHTIRLQPGDADACFDLARAYEYAGDTEQALAWYRRCLSLDTKREEVRERIQNLQPDASR